MFLYYRLLVSLFSSELVSKEKHLMYNTLNLLSNENRKRGCSHQKRRMFGETAWQVAISCQVSLQFAWILSWTRTTAPICETATWRLEDFVLKVCRINLIRARKQMSRNGWNCFWHIFKHRSTSLVNFIALECFILSREASRFALNFELQKRHCEGIPLISIFLKINRYSAKRTMQWFVSH